jgi:hypothetical protein
VNPVFASADITVEAIERTSAVRINSVVVKKPIIPALGFIEHGFDEDLRGHE